MSKLETSNTPKLLVSAREAAQMLGISVRALYDLLARGELPSVKLGGRRLFRPESLAALVAQRELASPPKPNKAK
jgi:excisionase family DNA binding protein